MLIHIPKVLSAEQVAHCRAELDKAEWADGRNTAGYLAQRVKDNQQVPDAHPIGRKLGEMVMTVLEKHPMFTSAALPLKMVPPLFNRYTGKQNYGRHVDGAIRPIFGTPYRVRTDLSATLFLAEPDQYDGGELVIEDTFGPRRVKLPAGDMVLYPGTSVHHVEPVTRGTRLASFFWIQSMVREDSQRTMLFELDNAIQALGRDVPQHPSVVQLAGLYHNLLRLWADA
jgi:PKHD-type hydroxylase